MTDKEILAQLKKSYEYLYDIRENGCEDHCNGQLRGFSIEQLESAMNNLANIYSTLRESLSDDEVLIILKGIEFGDNQGTYYIGNSICEDYSDVYSNEDDCFYSITCKDIGYYWYDDQEFLLSENNREVSI